MHSLADSQRMREALRALDLVVVIDVALTETARQADYVLPAVVAVREVGVHVLQPRVPAQRVPPAAADLRAAARHAAGVRDPLPPVPGARRLHRRRPRAARHVRRRPAAPRSPMRSSALAVERPALAKLAAVLLYETLGPDADDPRRHVRPPGAAAVWGLAQRCALGYADSIRRAGIGSDDELAARRRACSTRSSPRRTALTFTVDDYDETMRRLETADKKVSLAIPPCSTSSTRWQRACHAGRRRVTRSCSLPASAARRPPTRSNAIRRGARRTTQGALRVSIEDAARIGLTDGDRARITTKRGTAVAVVEVTDTLLAGPHHAAQRFRPRPRWVERRGRRGAQRADLVRRPRLVRRHAAPQARAAPASRRCRLPGWRP